MKYHLLENNGDYPHILMLDKEDEVKFLFSNTKYTSFIGDGKPVFKLEIRKELDEMFHSQWNSGMVNVESPFGRYMIFYISFKRKQDAIAWRLAKE